MIIQNPITRAKTSQFEQKLGRKNRIQFQQYWRQIRTCTAIENDCSYLPFNIDIYDQELGLSKTDFSLFINLYTQKVKIPIKRLKYKSEKVLTNRIQAYLNSSAQMQQNLQQKELNVQKKLENLENNQGFRDQNKTYAEKEVPQSEDQPLVNNKHQIEEEQVCPDGQTQLTQQIGQKTNKPESTQEKLKENSSQKTPQKEKHQGELLTQNAQVKKEKLVEITKKELRQYLKFATENDNLQKQINNKNKLLEDKSRDYQKVRRQTQAIKKQYNKIAKDMLAQRQNYEDSLKTIQKYQEKIKNLQQETKQIQEQNQKLSKRLKQQQKNTQKLVGLEETIKQLQKIVDVSSLNEQKYQREAQRLRQINKIEAQRVQNLQKEIENLRQVAATSFTMKQEVNRLSNQLSIKREAEKEYPQLQKKYEDIFGAHENLKNQNKQLQQMLDFEREKVSRLQKKLQALIQEKKRLQRKIHVISDEKQELQGQMGVLKVQVEQQRMQIEMQKKKYTGELRTLKKAFQQEHEKHLSTQAELQKSLSKQKQKVELQGVKLATLSKDDLFNIIEELEMKNSSLKMNLDDLLQQISKQSSRIESQSQIVFALSRQLLKAMPNLQESEGMQYVEKELVQQAKQNKDDWQEVLQKAMLENMRLKNSVTALGEEYNMRLRLELQKSKE